MEKEAKAFIVTIQKQAFKSCGSLPGNGLGVNYLLDLSRRAEAHVSVPLIQSTGLRVFAGMYVRFERARRARARAEYVARKTVEGKTAGHFYK